MQSDGTQPTRLGRKRDPSRAAAIREATLDVLAEVGYGGLSMDLVAERAGASKATIYRRWSSKEDLILAAVAGMSEMVDPAKLPDTGTLRGDLLALFKPDSVERTQRTMAVMTGLAAMLATRPEFADACDAVMVEPWAAAHRALMMRAVERGEASASADVETLSRVVASMAAYRSLIQRKPFEEGFLVGLVDGVLMPALHPGKAARDQPAPTRPSTSSG